MGHLQTDQVLSHTSANLAQPAKTHQKVNKIENERGSAC